MYVSKGTPCHQIIKKHQENIKQISKKYQTNIKQISKNISIYKKKINYCKFIEIFSLFYCIFIVIYLVFFYYSAKPRSFHASVRGKQRGPIMKKKRLHLLNC